VSDGAVTVRTSARAAGVAPSTRIVVRRARAGSVFTALMKILPPSDERLAVASRCATPFPSRLVSNTGPPTLTASRSSPRCSL
jgi:hypothetical protein